MKKLYSFEAMTLEVINQYMREQGLDADAVVSIVWHAVDPNLEVETAC
jgi:hypothetical protein